MAGQGLIPLRFVKNWYRNTYSAEANWDEIADNTLSYSIRTNNNLTQLALDVGGASYIYNNNGVRTEATPILDRLDVLEASDATGVSNLALDISTAGTIKITSADGSALSASNIGTVSIPSTSTVGEVVSYNITSDVSITLTGAHWGFDTLGDFTGLLRLVAIDLGSSLAWGVTARGFRKHARSADCFTTAASVTQPYHILTNVAVSSNSSLIDIGIIVAAFDDTGNPGGENYWTVGTSVGNVFVGKSIDSLAWSVDAPGYRSLYDSDEAGSRTVSFKITTGDFGIKATGKFFLDGADLSGNTYIRESSADTITYTVGGVDVFTMTSTGASTTSSANFGVQSTKFLYLDGGSNTYITETSADLMEFVTAGTTALSISATNFGIGSREFGVQATRKIYLDGFGDTYITETSANLMEFVTGGSTALSISTTNFGIASREFSIQPTKKIHLDSFGDTYITQSSDNVADHYAGGVLFLRGTSTTVDIHTNATFTTTGELVLGAVDPPTANYGNRNSFVRAWASFSAAGTLADSFNVSSVTTAASHQVFWNTDFASANYATGGIVTEATEWVSGTRSCPAQVTAKATTSATFSFNRITAGAVTAVTAAMDVWAMGDQ